MNKAHKHAVGHFAMKLVVVLVFANRVNHAVVKLALSHEVESVD